MMKSTKISVLILLVVLVLSTTSAFAVRNTGDNITVTEKVLFGDVAVVKNLTLDMQTRMGYTQYWNVKAPLGDVENSVVDHTVYKEYQHNVGTANQNRFIHINFMNNFTSHMSDGFDFDAEIKNGSRRHFYMPYLAMMDVATRTAPDSTYTETILLKEYYDHYPLEIDYNRWTADGGYGSLSDDAYAKLYEYFQFPVYEKEELVLTITKEGDVVTRVECQPMRDHTNIISTSFVNGNDIFLVAHAETTINDVTRIQGNAEVHHFEVFVKDNYEMEIGEITKVKTLDKDVYYNTIIENGTHIVALENKGSQSAFVVLSKDDFSELQRIPLEQFGESMELVDGAIILFHYDEAFIVLTQENGSYHIAFDGQFEKFPNGESSMPMYGNAFSFVDNKLICAREYSTTSFGMGDLFVAIYDEHGCCFMGQYTLSQKNDSTVVSDGVVSFESYFVS